MDTSRHAATGQPHATAPGDDVVVQTAALRGALELAVSVVAAGWKHRPALLVPQALQPYLRVRRLPDRALPIVRAALEIDNSLRRRVAEAASPDLVDAVGRAWLMRPEGWEETIVGMSEAVADRPGSVDGGVDELRRERRRRDSAEHAVQRAATELREVRAQLKAERLRRSTIADELGVMRQQLEAAEEAVAASELNLARVERRRSAAEERARGAAQAAAEATALANEAIAGRNALLADHVAPGFDDLRSSVDRLPAPRRVVRRGRTPLAIPGGIYGDSAAAAEFVLRSAGAVVLVDGYNVAKLGWPQLTLEQQREQCLTCAEDIARRWATRITVVFDGADVLGATVGRRRLVRVVFSPAGVSADDVLRRHVAAAEATRPVVVVTNDRAVVDDVRSEGANVLSSEQFLGSRR